MKYLQTAAAMALAWTMASPGGAFAADLTKAAQAENPNALIEGAAQEMLQELDAHRAEYRKNPEKVYELVDRILLPHFDTEHAARLILGQHWRTATPEQRKRFIDAFYRSLLENYGTALLDFTADRLKVLPFRGKSGENNATVRTQVRRDDGSTVDVNYTLRRTPQGWKAWDVTIEGISYVRNYRLDIGAQVEREGLDAVIRKLETEGYKPSQGGKS